MERGIKYNGGVGKIMAVNNAMKKLRLYGGHNPSAI